MPGAVLVTGGAGFAGRHLLQLLRADTEPLIAWHRPGGRAASSIDGVRWMAVDLLDRGAIAEALADVRPREIYHCAGAAHVGGSWSAVTPTLASNVLATHHLLTALRDLHLSSRVLIPGSAMVYRPREEPLDEDAPIGPTSPYGISKLAQEQLGVRAHVEDGRDVVLTRSFNHIGPGQDPSFSASGFARQIASIEGGLAEPVLRVGNLDARRDLTDVRDMVQAYRLLMNRGRPGVCYNVCSGQALPIREVLDRLLALARTPIAVEVDPARYRPNDTPTIVGRADRLRTETGWTPSLSLPRTLADILAYWRHELHGQTPAAQ